MGIELKEKFICGKKGIPELCEDMLVLTDGFGYLSLCIAVKLYVATLKHLG